MCIEICAASDWLLIPSNAGLDVLILHCKRHSDTPFFSHAAYPDSEAEFFIPLFGNSVLEKATDATSNSETSPSSPFPSMEQHINFYFLYTYQLQLFLIMIGSEVNWAHEVNDTPFPIVQPVKGEPHILPWLVLLCQVHAVMKWWHLFWQNLSSLPQAPWQGNSAGRTL